jgi:LuxR family transcriptional regulator, maltose regulon positive regulatory protein
LTPTLVVTKYTLPPLRPAQIERERLVERALAGLDRKLTLITAPPGFGKSTLAVELAHRAGRRAAWLSLDRGDNEPGRWGAYLAAALQQAGLPMGQHLQAILRLEGQPLLDAITPALINEVAGAVFPVMLVLDDYHAIQTGEIHEAVSLLLDRIPPNLHLVIVSRARPPLPLARLKVRGELTEITAADLRFTSDEASAFLHRSMGLGLPAEGVAALMARTEGWIAGLQLAALSLQGAGNWAAAIESFGGRSSDLLEYLLGEVLDHQPERIRSFLLQTALLDRLTGPLCDAVTGQTDGEATLRALEQGNLFLFPLDQERRWYRYHPLFADFLLARLRDTAGEADIAELHHRVAAWYHQQGELAQAVDHLLLAGAFDKAADWIEEGFADWSTRGSLPPLRRWVDQLPAHVMEQRPRLATLAAWVLTSSGDVQADHRFTQTAAYLTTAQRTLRQDAASGTDVREPLGVLSAVRTALAPWAPVRQCPMCIVQYVAHAEQCAAEARELLPGSSLFWRSVVSSSLGSVYLRAGDVAGAAQAFGEAARLGASSGNLAATVAAMHRHAQLLTMLGRLSAAVDAYREALRLADRSGAAALPIMAPIYLGLGLVCLERNDLDGAVRNLQEARDRYAAGGQAAPEALLALAQVAQARGDALLARDLVDQADDLLSARTKLRAAAVAAWPEGVLVLLAQGNLAAARRWVQEGGVAPGEEPGLWRAPEYLALARVLVKEGQADVALPLLRSLRATVAASGCRGLESEAWVVEGLALQALGDAGGAAGSLQAALDLTWSEGYVRLFAPAVTLLEQAQHNRTGAVPYRAYVDQLLAILAPERTAATPAAAVQALAEPLTEREGQILRLIASGSSNQDIAGELFMGVSTVKWHLVNIYGKLQVRSRTQAVARARELGLV